MVKAGLLLAALVVISWLVFTAGALRGDGAGGGDPIEAARGLIASLLEAPLASGDLAAPAEAGCRQEGIELSVATGQTCTFTVAPGGSRVRRGLIRLRQGMGEAVFSPAPSEATRPGPTARTLGGDRTLDLVAYEEGGELVLSCADAGGVDACRFRLERPA